MRRHETRPWSHDQLGAEQDRREQNTQQAHRIRKGWTSMITNDTATRWWLPRPCVSILIQENMIHAISAAGTGVRRRAWSGLR